MLLFPPSVWQGRGTRRVNAVGSVLSRANRSEVGHQLSRAHPSVSRPQMTRAEMSSCPRRTPWRAQVRWAWCRLCHDSPKGRIASGQTLVALSRPANGRWRSMWQIELIDQLTWCKGHADQPRPEERG